MKSLFYTFSSLLARVFFLAAMFSELLLRRPSFFFSYAQAHERLWKVSKKQNSSWWLSLLHRAICKWNEPAIFSFASFFVLFPFPFYLFLPSSLLFFSRLPIIISSLPAELSISVLTPIDTSRWLLAMALSSTPLCGSLPVGTPDEHAFWYGHLTLA